MKIAIVAPCPVPYTVGGAEKMWWGLQREINTNTSHQAEIIKLLTKEHSFWDLIDSYEAFARLDLSNFDLVISGKYPAWMVSHPRHLCYMQHRLRGLYDCYHYNNLAPRYTTTHPDLLALQELLDSDPSRESLDEVLFRLRNLRYQHEVPPDAFQFPGPLIKQVLEYLDGVGLSTAAIESYYSISETVAQRPGYFPSNAAVQVLYPPSNLEGLHAGAFDYIFTASRLDGAKRIHLLVEAMKFVKSEVELRIAGEGPDRARLEAAAKNDPRIRFVGFRSDAELIEDYANALAIAFLPQEEDYGLITVEAMMSGKPVITTWDSGGPTEFVEHEVSGLCVEPHPEQLGAAIDRIASDRNAARRMGKTARERVQPITWENTARELLATRAATTPPKAVGRSRRKLTVATTFPITPVRGGGQARIYHFYKNLVPTYDVDIITLGYYQEPPANYEIAAGVREIRIPKSPEQADAEAKISAEVEWFSITDVVFPMLGHLTPGYGEALARSCRDAEAVIASHPYAIDAIEKATEKPLWYEAHNVEYLLKRGVIPQTKRGLALTEEVRRVEQRCCDKARLILAASEEDSAELQRLYRAEPKKIQVVPNGTDSTQVRFVPRSRSQELKKELGLSSEFLAVFIGSWHPPNLDAVETIFRLAEQNRDIQFLVLGSSCKAFNDRTAPDNVAMFGTVDDATKALVTSAADLALNPMRNGSGTNLKMLEYAATGVPILSTRTGLRGLGFQPGADVFVAPLEEFSPAIEQIRNASPSLLQAIATRARERTEVQFDWRNISRRFLDAI